MNLIELLRAHGASDELIALAERWTARPTDDVAEGRVPTSDLTDAELAELRDGLIALGDDDDAPFALLEAAADAAVEIRAEEQQLADDCAAEEREREAARARLRGEEPEASDTTGDGESNDEPAEGDGEGGDGTPAEDGEGGEGAPTEGAEGEREPVTAGAGARVSRSQLARRTTRQGQPSPEVDSGQARARIVLDHSVSAITAGAGDAGPTLRHVDEALARRFGSFRGGQRRGGDAEFLTVATIMGEFPQERRLVDDQGNFLSATQIGQLVERTLLEVTTPEAIAAAGGLCGPLQPYYGVEVIGDDRRPVRDSALVSFQANRGGIISMAPPILAQTLDAIDEWDVDRDAAAADPESDDEKAIIRVVCGAQRESEIRAITRRLRFGNFLARSFPEWTQAWTQLTLVAHARRAEIILLRLIRDNPGTKTIPLVTTEVSAVRDVLNMLDQAAAGIRSVHRVLDGFPFRVILPDVFRTIARRDIANALPGGNIADNLAIADATIESFFRSRDLNITWSPDLNIMGPQADNVELANLPPAIDWFMYPEGSFLHLDAGELDLGVVRDGTTNPKNDFETFAETFEGVHFAGIESYHGTVNVCPSGAVRGTLDPTGVCASYT